MAEFVSTRTRADPARHIPWIIDARGSIQTRNILDPCARLQKLVFGTEEACVHFLDQLDVSADTRYVSLILKKTEE